MRDYWGEKSLLCGKRGKKDSPAIDMVWGILRGLVVGPDGFEMKYLLLIV